MKNIQFENAREGLCVICGECIDIPAIWECKECHKQCDVDNSRVLEKMQDTMIVDVKSKCCSVDVQPVGRITCSEKCHDEFVERLEKGFGEEKKVVDSTTGIAYRVPTKDIVERGLTWKDLPKYPVWEEN